MVLWLSLGLASEPAWSTLDTPGWAEMAQRDTDMGRVRVDHRKIGEVDCLQGTVVSPISPARLLAVAIDIPAAKRWSHVDLVFSETLRKEENSLDYAQMLDIPNWTLVADRFWVLRGDIIPQPGEAKVFRWHRIDGAAKYPKITERALAYHSGAIEPPINWGEWSFRPGPEGTVVRYRGCSDVGGSLPASVQKWVAQRTLPDTVADLLREAAKP